MTVSDFVSIAINYDTLMARAMLRACGVPSGFVGDPALDDGPPADAEVMACFRNFGSPMDGRF